MQLPHLFLLLLGCALPAAEARMGYRNDGSDVWPEARPPLRWNETTGEGVRWATPMPDISNASPIIAGNLVVTCSEPDSLIAVDRTTGRIAWQQVVDAFVLQGKPQRRAEFEKLYPLFHSQHLRSAKDSPDKRTWQHQTVKRFASLDVPHPHWFECGYTAPTPVTDGKRIFLRFGTGIVACYDLTGKQLWAALHETGDNTDLELNYPSPLLTDGKLIITYTPRTKTTGGSAAEYQGLIAYSADTGQVLWTTPFFRTPGWACGGPVLVDAGSTQVVVSSGGVVVRVSDGRILNKKLGDAPPHYDYIGITGEASTPSVVGDIVYFVEMPSHGQGKSEANRPRQDANYTYAVRLRVDGDQLQHERLWESKNLSPGRVHACYLVHEDLLYLMDRDLSLAVLDATNGQLKHKGRITIATADRAKVGHWRYPSWAVAGGKIHVNLDGGVFQVWQPGAPPKVQAENLLAPETSKWVPSRMCFHEDAIYVRTDRMLYCLAEKK